MTSNITETKTTTMNVRFEERTFPPHDAFHGTNEPMLWRRVTIELPGGDPGRVSGHAVFEQTDYGHAGRLNAWETRGVDSSLWPKLSQLEAIAAAVAAILS